ncbi:hypothetical protein [Marinobacter halotolerans]|uniref:hypothetical protein n=1 Tax=Marinobacter halotolerans TaxID=1569211 RepID=UPI0012460847|nr:hypothetical protein [Marinobacter halotolerans]
MERFLFYANSTMFFSVVGLVVTVLLAYPFADMLGMGLQVLAHIGTLLFAVGIKIAYVARLVFLSRLGRPVH